MDDLLRRFLRVVMITGKFLPGLGPAERWIPPLFSHSLVVSLNNELFTSNWNIVEEAVAHTPKWNKVEFQRKIQRGGRWLGTDPQLRQTIREFTNLGYLIDADTFAATPKLIDLLRNHAIEICRAVPNVSEQEATSRLSGKEIWLEANQITYDFLFRGIGEPWRKVRHEVNDAYKRYKGLKQTANRVGSHPSYWTVLNVVGMHEKLDRYHLTAAVRALEMEIYGGQPERILATADEMVEIGVFEHANGILNFNVLLRKLFSDYVAAIKKELPMFEKKIKYPYL